METKMKTIIGAFAACVLLAGIAAPASAETDVTEIVREYVKLPSSELPREVDVRRFLPRQKEYIADKLPTGSSDWWQQMDREGRGGRR
jgi:hypothetical protein